MRTLIVILLFLLIFLIVPKGKKVIIFIFGIPYFGLKYFSEWIESHMKKLVAKKQEEPKRYQRALFIYSRLYEYTNKLCGYYESLYDSLSK